jgi:hypothetical protein
MNAPFEWIVAIWKIVRPSLAACASRRVTDAAKSIASPPRIRALAMSCTRTWSRGASINGRFGVPPRSNKKRSRLSIGQGKPVSVSPDKANRRLTA